MKVCGYDDSEWYPLSDDEYDESLLEARSDEEGDRNSSAESSGDESIILFNADLCERVTGLFQNDTCDDHCLRGKADQL